MLLCCCVVVVVVVAAVVAIVVVVVAAAADDDDVAVAFAALLTFFVRQNDPVSNMVHVRSGKTMRDSSLVMPAMRKEIHKCSKTFYFVTHTSKDKRCLPPPASISAQSYSSSKQSTVRTYC